MFQLPRITNLFINEGARQPTSKKNQPARPLGWGGCLRRKSFTLHLNDWRWDSSNPSAKKSTEIGRIVAASCTAGCTMECVLIALSDFVWCKTYKKICGKFRDLSDFFFMSEGGFQSLRIFRSRCEAFVPQTTHSSS